MARDAKMDELRQLGVRRPGELEKCFDFVAMAFAILSGKESIRIDDFIVKDNIERLSQRHLRRLPHFARVRRRRDKDQRLTMTVSFVIKINAGGQMDRRHGYTPHLLNSKNHPIKEGFLPRVEMTQE